MFLNPNFDSTKEEIDHRDHNRTNNSIENLAIVSRSENKRNTSSYNGKEFKFIDNMTNKYSDQLLSIIRDKVDEVNNTYYPGFASIANRCVTKIRYNNKDKFDGYMKSINSYNIQPDSIRTIGDIVIVNDSRMRWITSQIIITPETIGYDNSTLSDWVTLKSSFNDPAQQKTPCDVYIFGFKNLKNIDNIFVVTKLKEIKSSELKEKETKKETSDEVKPKEEKQLTMSDFFEEFKI